MRVRSSALVVMVLLMVAAACGDDGSTGATTTSASTSSAAPSLPVEVQVTEDVPYTSERDVAVFGPTEGSDWPVVVYLHGGVVPDDYPSGADRDLLTAIAAQGVVVYAPRWESSGPNGGSQDSICAVAFAAETSGDYGGDPGRVTLAGYSAGGYGAVIGGFTADDPPLPVTDCVVEPDVDPLPAVVSGGGPFFVADAARAGLLPAPAWTSLTPEQIDAFDPYMALERNPDLVVRLWVGENDQGGNPAQPFPIADSNREYHAALLEAGSDAELMEVPGDHLVIETDAESFIDLVVETARPD